MYTEEYAKIAICRGGITGAELISGGKWETYRKEYQKFGMAFSKWLPCVMDCVKYRDIISGELWSISDIRNCESPVQFDVDDHDDLILYPQVIIHYKTGMHVGKAESKVFKTNKEAEDFFNSLVWKNNLVEKK